MKNLPKKSKFLPSLSISWWQRIAHWLVPIHKHELKKFVPIFLIFFLLTFVYDLLRPLKSALIIAEPGVGAELIPYIKVWGVLPGAFLLTGLTIRLGHYFSRERVFYSITLLYLLFYLLFIFVLYPFRQVLGLDSVALFLKSILPTGLQHFAVLFSKWPLVLFYAMTELWGNILLSMLFWGFSNEINTIQEARRFYPLFLLGANSAAIFSGSTGAFFSRFEYTPLLPYGTNAWEQALLFFVLTAVIGALIIMALFKFVHQTLPHISHEEPSEVDHDNQKIKLTIRQCLIHVFKNPYLGCLAVIVLSYNLVFNLSDILWTNELSKAYGSDINGYTLYTSQVTTITGFISVFVSIFVTGNVLRKFGWKHAALITPTAVFVCAVGFFLLLVSGYFEIFSSGLILNVWDPVQLTLLLGTMQMAVSRGCKYTVFDTTKEIAFIPLSAKDQRLGKAVIDGIGSRLGKSSGSFIFQILFLLLPTLDAMIPIISCLVLLTLAVWLWATISLSKRFSG